MYVYIYIYIYIYIFLFFFFCRALKIFNPFLANAPMLNPLNTRKNLWFSGVLTGFKMRTLVKNVLKSDSHLPLQ